MYDADAIVAAVPHHEFLQKKPEAYLQKIKRPGCFIDVKAKFNALRSHDSQVRVWRL